MKQCCVLFALSVPEPVRLEYVVCICMRALMHMPKALFWVEYAL